MTGFIDTQLRRTESGSTIVLLGLANPQLNLVTVPLLKEFHETLTALGRDAADPQAPNVPRAVVLHQGEARAFCAGSDMREFAAVAEGPAEGKVLLENHVLRKLAHLPVPVVAAIDGPALGGGLELSLACDLRICGRSAVLGVPEAGIGGLAGSGSQRLTKLVGPGRAKELLFTAKPISAATAADWGLVNDVVDDDMALEAAIGLAELMTTRAPRSLALSKSLVDRATDTPLDQGLAEAISAQEEIFSSADLHEGAAAFGERRQPRFVGR